eukprot:5188026-Pleurochrysis_carterae.AAC.1
MELTHHSRLGTTLGVSSWRTHNGGTGEVQQRKTRQGAEIYAREPCPTLYPGVVVGDEEDGKKTSHRADNTTQLTKRARDTKQKRERKDETYRDKRMRQAKGEKGTRIVSDTPERKIGGGEWVTPAQKEDTAARNLLGGQ